MEDKKLDEKDIENVSGGSGSIYISNKGGQEKKVYKPAPGITMDHSGGYNENGNDQPQPNRF